MTMPAPTDEIISACDGMPNSGASASRFTAAPVSAVPSTVTRKIGARIQGSKKPTVVASVKA